MITAKIVMERDLQIMQALRDIARATAAESGELKEAEEYMGELAADAARHETPIRHGVLMKSHAVFTGPQETYVAIEPEIVNPWSPEDPIEYGPKVHQLGGISRSGHRRDFYVATVELHGDDIVAAGADFYVTTLEAIFPS